MVLTKERVVRDLYRGEVAWLVYCTQSRALGLRFITPEMQVTCAGPSHSLASLPSASRCRKQRD